MAFAEFPSPITSENYSLGASHPLTLNLGSDYTPRRFFVWSGAPPSPAAPGAGVAVHGVSGWANNTGPDPDQTRFCVPACSGYPFLVETGASYSSGVALKTDSSGRAIAQGGSGVIVATALEASDAAGGFRWAVFA